MANQFYAKGIEKYLEGSIASLSDTVKVGLWSTAYTPVLATDEFYSTPVAASAIIAAGVALTSKSGAAGTLSAANTTFTSVSGTAAAYLGIYKDTGVNATSPLIALFDTATGLPVTPNGGDIAVAWASGAVYTLCKGLSERERSLVRAMWEWMNDALKIPARLGPGGLWLPTPQVVQI